MRKENSRVRVALPNGSETESLSQTNAASCVATAENIKVLRSIRHIFFILITDYIVTYIPEIIEFLRINKFLCPWE
jgi:hypothetical protein